MSAGGIKSDGKLSSDSIGIGAGTTITSISTDTSLGGGSPSDALIPSQKAIKSYVDVGGTNSAWLEFVPQATNPGDANVLWRDTAAHVRMGEGMIPEFSALPAPAVANSVLAFTNDTTGHIVQTPVTITSAGAAAGFSSIVNSGNTQSLTQSIVGGPLVRADWYTATVNSVGAASVLLWSFTTVAGNAYTITVDIAGRNTTATGLITEVVTYGCRNQGAGAVNSTRLNQIYWDDFAIGKKAVSLSTAGAATQVSVRGSVGNSYVWSALIKVVSCLH